MSKVLVMKTGYCEFLDRDKDSREVSLGDVLRITPLLNLYKNDQVTFVTDEKAFPLIKGNPYVGRLLKLDYLTTSQLQDEIFDTVINLEKVGGICALCDRISTNKRYGFTFNKEEGRAEALDNAYEVLAVSSDPKFKKENTRTSQLLLFEMVGQKWGGEDYVLGYKPEKGIEFDVGFNTLVGNKWPNKAWPVHKWDSLERLLKEDGISVTRQDKQASDVLTNLYRYMDWMNSCKLVVTNDSLGLHLSLALKKKSIGLFGPTPHQEFEFYGRGHAIFPSRKIPCMPCFESSCQNDSFCMDVISVDEVYDAVKVLMEKSNGN